MIPSDFHFQAKAFAYLFLFVPLFGFLFWQLFHYRQGLTKQLGRVLIPRSRLLYILKSTFFCLAWTAATLALMQPVGNAHYPEEMAQVKASRTTQEVILLIDTSASMGATDSGQGTSRLDEAKEIADQIVRQLTGQSVSLYAFTSEVTPLSPATLDYLFVRLQLRDMSLNEGDVAGSSLLTALKTLHNQMRTLPSQRAKQLILLTDGGDAQLETLDDQQRESALTALLELYDDAATLHLHVDAIGMGSKKGAVVPDVTYHGGPVYSSLQDELLRRLARRTGGVYLEANESHPAALANQIFQAIQEQATSAEKETHPSQTTGGATYTRYYQIPLALALFFLLLALVLPDTRKRRP